MTLTNKLTKAITNAIVYGRTTQASEQDQATTQVLVNDCLDAVERHSDWVCVDEQQPQDDIAYLVLCDDGSVWMGHYNLPVKPNDWYLHGWGAHGGWHPFVVTHFMLPPQPPSEVQDD